MSSIIIILAQYTVQHNTTHTLPVETCRATSTSTYNNATILYHLILQDLMLEHPILVELSSDLEWIKLLFANSAA